MALEAGTHISDLVAANPLATDKRHEGDDHMRLLKTCVKNSLPIDLRGLSGGFEQEGQTLTISTDFQDADAVDKVRSNFSLLQQNGTFLASDSSSIITWKTPGLNNVVMASIGDASTVDHLALFTVDNKTRLALPSSLFIYFNLHVRTTSFGTNIPGWIQFEILVYKNGSLDKTYHFIGVQSPFTGMPSMAMPFMYTGYVAGDYIELYIDHKDNSQSIVPILTMTTELAAWSI